MFIDKEDYCYFGMSGINCCLPYIYQGSIFSAEGRHYVCSLEFGLMAAGSNGQQNFRKAMGALKDSTMVGMAKVNSVYKVLLEL